MIFKQFEQRFPMKHFTQIHLFLGLLLIFSCSENLDETLPEVSEESQAYSFSSRLKPPKLTAQRKIRDQLVVKYVSGLTEPQKQIVRDKYFVNSIKKCKCADERLEQWTLNMDSIGGVEEIKGEAATDPDLEGVDYQYQFQQNSSNVNTQMGSMESLLNLIKSENDGVTVAIIDSGLDFDHSGFETPFLYNSKAAGDYCIDNKMEEVSGWDFVNQDNVPEDAHGHGTIVTDIIERTVVEAPFQILPVKAFDSNGKGTTFDITCAIAFSVYKTDVKIINMSFGWYYEQFEILPDYINEASGEVLVICSSGNQGVYTDIFNHYPSGYDYYNILSVGGMGDSDVTIAPYSNYGPVSVDLAAPSYLIEFESGSGLVEVSGTSFSASFATARSIMLHSNYTSPIILKSLLVLDSDYNSSLFGLTKYPKVISP